MTQVIRNTKNRNLFNVKWFQKSKHSASGFHTEPRGFFF